MLFRASSVLGVSATESAEDWAAPPVTSSNADVCLLQKLYANNLPKQSIEVQTRVATFDLQAI